MAAKAKENLQLLQKDEIKCRELIINFKKVLNLWFMHGLVDNAILNEVLNSCVEVILHGLKTQQEKQTQTFKDATSNDSSMIILNASSSKNYNNDQNLNEIQKLIDDFEWVRNTVSIRRTSNNVSPPNTLREEDKFLLQTHLHNQISQSSIVSKWLRTNINKQNLCAFLQYLVNDKELLNEHYEQEALLRQENYVSVFILGLTAFETKQCGLLSQMEDLLKENLTRTIHHRRSNSQPNFILVPKFETNSSIYAETTTITTAKQQCSTIALNTIRKTQSLPEFIERKSYVNDTFDGIFSKRPRCKTLGTIKYKKTNPRNIPQKSSKSFDTKLKAHDSHISTSSSSGKYPNDDNQPTTSQASSNRSKSSLSNYTLNSSKSATSLSSCSSNNTAKCIQLINTDDIKIYTDHTWELKQKGKTLEATASCDIPARSPTHVKPSKSVSPINSFFCSLFNTPPSYTSWFVDPDLPTEDEATETAIESIIPDNNFPGRSSILSSQQQSPSLSLGSTVFDKFLPVDGKKVRTRKSQNLFEDANTTLNCSSFNIDVPTATSSAGSTSVNSKNCQSLTRFLQMSHLSRNNTDLEKENAHFRISEAIISAIEHIKWNRLEKQKDKSYQEATPLATDCLASSNSPKPPALTISCDAIEGEHLPFAELEEVSYDLLSAEVVGLSLISKFDEKHLPKVSELKWLVSDDDTPQKLLPMPDLSSSANPDDHVVHPATRGTRYWAPPRQQIIFTDHPTPKRKEVLKLQNYRCAGCGMRVSSQYMQSFRYCTYFGKYHCTGCHRNQISATPAKILQSWDFKCYPVSVFAYRLLEQMYNYPLFYVPDLNPALYIRCTSLLAARNKRLQLKYVKDFIRLCRFALREQSFFETVPDYITGDVDNWSMSDFVDARTKCLHRSIDELIIKCENHIYNCVLCTARGFLCEFCHKDDVIYPWGSQVERCNCCGACFHRSCWKSISERCCRCQRFEKRNDEINDVI